MKVLRVSDLEIRAHDYVDYLTIYSNPRMNHMEIVLMRRIQRLQESLTLEQQLPVWLQFAKARQGSE